MNANIILVRPLVFLTLLVLLAVSGCSDDDPVTPIQLPETGYLATSPDSLMVLWQTALTTMDSTMYHDLYDPFFQFHFSDGDMSEYQPPTDFMTREETVRTGWNMFSGQDITNWLGVFVPGVARIQFPVMTQDTPWSIVTVGSAPPVANARFTLQMYVERGYGLPTIFAAGSYDFFAVGRDTIPEGGTATTYYSLILIEPIEPVKDADMVNSWGGVHLTYLTNEAPTASLAVTDIGGSPLPVFRCDASSSSDPEGGLHETPYRWRFESGDSWTEWTEDPLANRSYSTPGDYTISVEVRDRWGATDVADHEVTVLKPPLPFPGSPDVLMANFQTIYETMDFDGYREILHPDFLTVLQTRTTEEFPDVGTTLDVNEELRIHQRMFSGEAVTDPNGDFVPGIVDIYFNNLQAQDTWTMSPPDDIIPNAEWALFQVQFLFSRGMEFSTLRVDGIIKFYVTSRDSLYEGSLRQYYQMVGQVDLTDLKGVEETPWGTVKALFR